MFVSKVVYKGDLRTEATHLKSGNIITTDAPTDNQGKGEAFSPTDLVASATASCMLTIMGIVARKYNLQIKDAVVDVAKIMTSDPRRIAEIHVIVHLPQNHYTEKDKRLLEHAAKNCPVIKSLSSEIVKVIDFKYGDTTSS
jgi:uncharacterized OsmC-like protein